MTNKCYRVQTEVELVDRVGRKEKVVGREWRDVYGLFRNSNESFKSERSAKTWISKMKSGKRVKLGAGKDVKFRINKC